MIHDMNLNPDAFEAIKAGKKNVNIGYTMKIEEELISVIP